MISEFFPFLSRNVPDVSKLRMTTEGVYSITRPAEAMQLIRFMHKHVGPFADKVITDGTANVGGETIHYALAGFQCVHAIELNPENMTALRSNIRAYGPAVQSRVRTHLGDTVRLFEKYKSDVIVIDPPWGGPNYRDAESLDLYLGTVRVDVFLRERIMQKPNWRPQWVFLKLPSNYNWSRLHGLRMHRQKIRNYFVVAIEVPAAS